MLIIVLAITLTRSAVRNISARVGSRSYTSSISCLEIIYSSSFLFTNYTAPLKSPLVSKIGPIIILSKAAVFTILSSSEAKFETRSPFCKTTIFLFWIASPVNPMFLGNLTISPKPLQVSYSLSWLSPSGLSRCVILNRLGYRIAGFSTPSTNNTPTWSKLNNFVKTVPSVLSIVMWSRWPRMCLTKENKSNANIRLTGR